jgi:hypothetical protein
MPTITFRGTREELRRLLATVPGILAGRSPDPLGVARGFQLRLSQSLLSQIQTDFLTLSRGGVSRDGRSWPPLAPSTIARRLVKGRKAIRGGKGSPQLAGQIDILRDTSRLFRSLAAGVDEVPAGNPDQVLRLGPGELIVGTNVEYAHWHQTGVPGRLPARPFLPVGGVIPAAYQSAIASAAIRGLARVVELLAARAG